MTRPLTMRDLAEKYRMNPRTFKKHAREILERHACYPVRINKTLDKRIIQEIETLMGDYTRYPGSATIKQLARMYGMSYDSMRNRLEPIKHLLKAKVRGKYVLTARDLKVILDHLGPP